jgi:two-component system, cell cycle sensor histidine kinase and response regulator CckA
MTPRYRMAELEQTRPPGHPFGQDDLAELARVDSAWKRSLDRATALACRLLDVPVAQVNVILEDRQLSVSSVAPHPDFSSWNGPREVPLEGSYCKHVAGSGKPLVIENSEEHPLVYDHPATTEAGIRAYAAVPLKDDQGRTLATLCVVDFEPRLWDPERLEALTSLAEMLMDEVGARIRAEGDLEAGEARFRALIEHGADLTTILDPDGRIRYASPAYERVLGHPPRDVVGRSFAEFVHASDREGWRNAFFAGLDKPSIRLSGEWRMHHRDGHWRTVEGTGVNLLHLPAVGGIVLNIIDVSKEKRIELELHQAQKMEAVGRLAGGVAHDFNNLLTAIKGNTAFLLARGDLSSEAEADVREMLDAVKRASGLTRQLLSFSRDQVLDIRVRDLGVVVEEIVPLVKRLLGAKVQLATSLDKELPILIDEGQVGQVIMNLAVNARDAMPRGGTLRIETHDVTVTEAQSGSHSDIRPGRYAQLVVADDGEGMSRKVQQKIFDPFFSTKPKGKGTGLGLSITWGVVNQMGGHIHVYSEPGRGTTFRIYFPWADRKLLERDDEGSRTEQQATAAAPATVLVVEDQPEIRRIMRKVLEADGHTVILAETGEEALALASDLEAPPDLLLSDVLLPGITGPEVAWKLSERWPDLTVVFTSGYTRGELVSQDVELRSAAFLPKPFGPEELSRSVADALVQRG